MAYVPRMTHEAWPAWAKLFFVVGALLLLLCGIMAVIITQHTGGAVLGIISIVVALLFLYGLFIRGWLTDPAS